MTDTKSDVNTDSTEAKKLKQQIEFYFSDSNFPRDKFLRNKAAENDGWVPIEVIATFNKVKQISTDVDFISKVLRTSEVLQVSEDGKRVRRLAPLPEVDTLDERSIYVKGFPQDETAADVTVESVSNFFQPYGKVLSVRLRRTKEKRFKGSVFVEFSTVEEAKKAAAAQGLKWKDQYDLLMLMKKEYIEQKKKELKEKRKRKREESEKKNQNETNPKKEITEGLIVKVEHIGDSQPISRDELKSLFSQFGQVKYVEFNDQEKKAFIRFATKTAAESALKEYADGSKEIGGNKVVVTLLTGDEEKEYWQKNIIAKSTQKKTTKKRRKN
jgi:lupus La protein